VGRRKELRTSRRPQSDEVLLIIEVAGASLAFDRGEKAMLYAESGIKRYWIVNLEEKCLEVFRDPQNGRDRS
jgi:Uma2 family endonuclease